MVAGLLGIAVGSSLYCWWLAVVRHQAPPAPALSKAEITAGVPIQRKRIDDFIAMTGSYRNFDELAAGLNDRLKEDVLVAAGMSESPTGHNIFGEVLADRRMARLYEMLAQMRPSDADQRVGTLFDSKLDIHFRDCWKRINEIRGPEVPEDKLLLLPIRQNYRALSCATFLASRFCPVSEVLRRLEQWNARAEEIATTARADPALKKSERAWTRPFGLYNHPSNILLANIYLSCLERKGPLGKDWLRERLSEDDWRSLQPQVIPLVSWDAHTGPFDFTHRESDRDN
jgi:hypothetical protein